MGPNDDEVWLRGDRPSHGGRSTLAVVDLFAGCGGLSLGVREAARQRKLKFDVRLAVEQNRLAAVTYAANFGVPVERVLGDVIERFNGRVGRRLTVRERALRGTAGHIDLLLGGPPCQGHSTLNNHTRGDDPKNELYLAMVRAAEVLEPASVLIENVPAIERDASDVVSRAVERLEKRGYRVSTAVVDLLAIGVPQTRRRHVLVAHHKRTPDVTDAIEKATVPEPRTVEWAFRGLREVGDSVFDGAPKLSARNLQRANVLLRNKIYDLPSMLRPPCQQGDHKYKSMYGRLNWALPAQTITTGYGSPGQGRYFHPERPRALTAHEAARIQFLPDWFDFRPLPHREGLATAIGNAVPPKLAFVLAHHLCSL